MWQLWIKHFIDHYPNFHGEMKDAYGKGRFSKIGNLLFQKGLCIGNMAANDLGIGLGYNPKQPKQITSEKEKAKKVYQNQVDAYNEEKKQIEDGFDKIKNLNAEHRLEWYLQRMLERLANKKRSIGYARYTWLFK